MRKTPRLLIAILFVIALIAGIFLAINYAKGYRPSLKNKALQGTGLLAANSSPKGASVFINDKLTTATDDTLNLPPGEYAIKIAKDGYIPWEKTLTIEAELVTQTNTRLFPSVPDLKPLTFSGALNPTPSPDGQKIVFAVENATTDTKNGLYVIDLTTNPLNITADPRQITRTSQKYDFLSAQLTWSPDSSQILATLNSSQPDELNVLLNPNSFNDIADLKDVSAQLPVILTEWQDLIIKKDHEKLIQLPEFMQTLATQSAQLFYFSPDENKLMYLASDTVDIPAELIPPLPASSTQLQTRQIEPGKIYIYDLEEDKNFLLDKAQPLTISDNPTTPQKLTYHYSGLYTSNTQWFPDSSHLLTITTDENNQSKIIISEYDNTNQHVVYAGPFANQFAYPWPNGNRLLILASLNGGSNLPPNLYSINLK